MEITQAEWTRFKNMLSAINTRAVDDMMDWLESKGGIANVSFQEMSSYGYALATKYGEASASLSAQMYDEVAAASGMTLPAAEVADTVSYTEIAKAITKVAAQTQNAQRVSDVVGRYTKRTGADTMLKNAERDGAQFAWVPAGDSCAFCIALASRGWQFISKKSFKNGHAEHIHTNCDCTYAVRFDKKTNVAGYDPQVYKDMYYGAEGNTPQEKINSMRRIQYQDNKDKINAQKRANYAAKNEKFSMKRNSETSWTGKAVNITEAQLSELKDLAASKGFYLDPSFNSFDGDVKLVKDFINTMDSNLSNKTYMRHTKIKLSVSYTMKDADYAETQGSNIIINGFAYRDRELLKKDYEEKVKIGWFTKESSYYDIATHESGHVIVYKNQLRTNGVTEAVYGKDKIKSANEILNNISEYALKNDDELIAEAYVKYRNGSTDESVLRILEYCGII